MPTRFVSYASFPPDAPRFVSYMHASLPSDATCFTTYAAARFVSYMYTTFPPDTPRFVSYAIKGDDPKEARDAASAADGKLVAKDKVEVKVAPVQDDSPCMGLLSCFRECLSPL